MKSVIQKKNPEPKEEEERTSPSPPPSPEPVKASEPVPEPESEPESEPETKTQEASSEAEPVTQQPQKAEEDGQSTNADKAGEKVMSTGWTRTVMTVSPHDPCDMTQFI